MRTTQPIEIEGEIYPLYSASLAINSTFKNGNFEACASMRLVPTRLDPDGNAVILEDNSKTILVGNTNEISGAEKEAMQEIYSAVQKYINIKSL